MCAGPPSSSDISTQSGCESEHHLHPFYFIEPISQRRFDLADLWRKSAGWTVRTKSFQGQGAVAIERAVSRCGTPPIIFGKELHDGDAAASVDAQFLFQLYVHLTFDKTQIDPVGQLQPALPTFVASGTSTSWPERTL